MYVSGGINLPAWIIKVTVFWRVCGPFGLVLCFQVNVCHSQGPAEALWLGNAVGWELHWQYKVKCKETSFKWDRNKRFKIFQMIFHRFHSTITFQQLHLQLKKKKSLTLDFSSVLIIVSGIHLFFLLNTLAKHNLFIYLFLFKFFFFR